MTLMYQRKNVLQKKERLIEKQKQKKSNLQEWQEEDHLRYIACAQTS